MIAETSIFLKDELSKYLLRAGVVLHKDDVLLGNISKFQTHNTRTGKVVISLVNIEEESTLKTVRNPMLNNEKSGPSPLNLNLYFLITATSDEKTNKSYEDALSRISTIIKFFHSTPILTLQYSAGFSPTNSDNSRLTVRSRLISLNFEQINHLWSSLGCKQSPFVIYEIGVVNIYG